MDACVGGCLEQGAFELDQERAGQRARTHRETRSRSTLIEGMESLSHEATDPEFVEAGEDMASSAFAAGLGFVGGLVDLA